MALVKDTVLIGPGERYDLELDGNNPGVWMFHCHMENHAANGMMSLIQYDGAVPTGLVGAFFTPDGGVAAGAAEHMHGEPTAPSSRPRLPRTVMALLMGQARRKWPALRSKSPWSMTGSTRRS